MKKEERERLKLVVYEAYMTGQARGEKTEQILEALEQKFGVCQRTLQNWIYDVDKRRKATIERLEHLEEALKGKTLLDIRQIIGITDHMIKGLRVSYDEKTNEILYEAPDWF